MQDLKGNPAAMPARRATKTNDHVEEHQGLADLDLLIVNLEATKVEQERGEPVSGYRVTLTGIWPEGLAPVILAAAKDHKLKVRILVASGVRA